MRACAEPSADRPSTWITDDFERVVRRASPARARPQRRGLGRRRRWSAACTASRWADSSAASRCSIARTDASKAAVGHLIERLRAGGFSLCDAQVPTPHLERLGAINIPRTDYLARLRRALAHGRAASRLRDRRAAAAPPSTQTRLRPARLAAYSASSARDTSSTGVDDPGRRRARHADADRHRNRVVPANTNGAPRRWRAGARTAPRPPRASSAARDDRELLAAVAREDLVLAEHAHDQRRQLHQHVVARLVAVHVVDALEVIDVEEDRATAASRGGARTGPRSPAAR